MGRTREGLPAPWRRQAARAIYSALGLMHWACADAPDPPQGALLGGVSEVVPWRTINLRLAEVRRFGWEELADSTRPLSARERRAGGAVLSRPVGLDEDPEGRINVLDADYQKIVVFDTSGALRSVIPSSYGRGPGEFYRPRALTIDAEGRRHVLDVGNTRVTTFSPAGLHEADFALDGPPARYIMAAGGRIYVSRAPWQGAKTAVLVFERGQLVDSLVEAYDQLRHLSEHGESGILGRGGDGVVLFGHPAPSLWTEIAGDTTTRGIARYPDARGLVDELVPGQFGRTTPVGTRGLGRLQDGRTVVWYTERGDDGGRRFFLDVFDERLAYIGSAELSENEQLFGRMLTPRRGARLYFTDHGDLPSVVVMELVDEAGR